MNAFEQFLEYVTTLMEIAQTLPVRGSEDEGEIVDPVEKVECPYCASLPDTLKVELGQDWHTCPECYSPFDLTIVRCPSCQTSVELANEELFLGLYECLECNHIILFSQP